jgi:hypothetical protein
VRADLASWEIFPVRFPSEPEKGGTVPGGFEDFYRHVGEAVKDRTKLPPRSAPDVAALSATAARYGVTIAGPPPGA